MVNRPRRPSALCVLLVRYTGHYVYKHEKNIGENLISHFKLFRLLHCRGYALGQIPAGRMAHRYGAKRVFATSIIVPAILTLLMPIACETHFILALALRALIGLFASGNFPSIYTYFYIWIAPKEKTSAVACTVSGMYMGEIVGFSLSGYLTGIPMQIQDTNMGNWRLLFYFFGLVAIGWVPLWLYFTYEKPEDHPYMTAEELKFIKTPIDDDAIDPKNSKPYVYNIYS